jgi:hypothetical protein
MTRSTCGASARPTQRQSSSPVICSTASPITGHNALSRKRVGTTLVRAMEQLARDLGCYGMWVPIDAGDAIAISTYRAGGAGEPGSAAIMSWSF